jgi:hypothetical protein
MKKRGENSMWTNKALQALINDVGERINSISLNNGKYLFIGYESGTQLKDISFETYNGVDVMKIHHKQQQGGTVIEWDTLITTEFIEGIEIMDKKSENYRIDPLILK